MLGCITVKKKIYAGETAQISVGLLIGELESLGKSADARHHILDPVKYFILFHTYAFCV